MNKIFSMLKKNNKTTQNRVVLYKFIKFLVSSRSKSNHNIHLYFLTKAATSSAVTGFPLK